MHLIPITSAYSGVSAPHCMASRLEFLWMTNTRVRESGAGSEPAYSQSITNTSTFQPIALSGYLEKRLMPILDSNICLAHVPHVSHYVEHKT